MATKGRKVLLLGHRDTFLGNKEFCDKRGIEKDDTEKEVEIKISIHASCANLEKPHPFLPGKTIKIFEGCHLKDFILAKIAEYRKGFDKYSSIPEETRKLIEDLTDNDSKPLYNIISANSNSLGVKNPRSKFKAISKILEISEHESLLAFLIFCKEESLPLRAFETEHNLPPKEVIDDIGHYLLDVKEKEPHHKFIKAPKEDADNLTGIKSNQNNHHLKGVNISKDSDDTYIIERCNCGCNLSIPKLSNVNLSLDLSSFLDWQRHITPFIGRNEELGKLQDWLDLPDKRNVILMCGDGGTGKTRLAFHFADLARSQGWEAGQTNSENFTGNWRLGAKGLLLIIDYPESHTRWVKHLLRAVDKFASIEQGQEKLRIMLLSRNQGFLKTMVQDVSRYLYPEPIRLTEFYDREEIWSFVKKTWEGFRNTAPLRTKSLPNAAREIPFDGEAFFAWKQKSFTHRSPLMLTALVIYLVEEKINNINDLVLRFEKTNVIQYIVEREERAIRNEVEEFNKTNGNDENIEPEPILLLKAIAQIRNGLNEETARNLIGILNNEGFDYSLPKVSKLKRLSVWNDNKIPTMQPDLLASNFFVHCFNQCATVNEKAKWMAAALGLPQINDCLDAHSSVQS
jgi:hypothetical protein